MNNTYIFVADRMLEDEDYKRIISREDAEYYDGLVVTFDKKGDGLCTRPDNGSFLYPIKKEHCVEQMSLF